MLIEFRPKARVIRLAV